MPVPYELCDLDLPGDHEVHALLAACPEATLLRYADDERLIRGGDPSNEIFLLLRGTCLVEHPDAPEPRQPGHALAILEATPEAPVFVGEMAYLGEGLRTASVRSAMNSVVIRLLPKHLDLIIERFPHFTRSLCRQFTTRLREANDALRAQRQERALDAEQRFIDAGALICEAGAPATELFQLVDGSLLEETASGTTVEHRSGGSAPVFLEARAYFRGDVYAATLRAKGACLVVAIGAGSRAAVLRNYPELAIELLRA